MTCFLGFFMQTSLPTAPSSSFLIFSITANTSAYVGRAPVCKHLIVQSSLSQPLCLKEEVLMINCPLNVELCWPKAVHQVQQQQKMYKKHRQEIFFPHMLQFHLTAFRDTGQAWKPIIPETVAFSGCITSISITSINIAHESLQGV